MITRIHSVNLPVSDQDVALDFFVNTLGWEKRIDNMVGENYRFLTVAPRGAGTELALGASAGEDANGGLNSSTPIFSLITDDVDATYEDLLAKGVTFKVKPQVEPWGAKGALFVDPDGNEFYITTD